MKIQITEEKITPKIAERYLGGNTHNRPMRNKHITFLAGEMKAGRWVVNGETIKFAPDGTLMDGQHRLWAISESGVTVSTLVARNVPADSFDTIDSGLKRTGGDTLSVDGEASPAALSAAAYAFVELRYGGQYRNRIPNREIRQIVAENSDLKDAVAVVKEAKMGKIIANAVSAALFTKFNRLDASMALRFVVSISKGLGLKTDDPFYLLREALLKNMGNKAKLDRQHIMALCIKAWNTARTGKNSKVLRWSKMEQFPQIH